MDLEELLGATMSKIEQEEKQRRITITMGEYIQNSLNKSPIEWIVIDDDNGKKLVISKYGIDAKIYDSLSEQSSWGTCSLRKWLNEDFINIAFSDEEKEQILETRIFDNSSEVIDKIFLLDSTEVGEYFKGFNSEKTSATEYAQSHGAPNGSMGNTIWWLREPGSFSSDIFGSSCGKAMSLNGPIVDEVYAIRPAMWIKNN